MGGLPGEDFMICGNSQEAWGVSREETWGLTWALPSSGIDQFGWVRGGYLSLPYHQTLASASPLRPSSQRLHDTSLGSANPSNSHKCHVRGRAHGLRPCQTITLACYFPLRTDWFIRAIKWLISSALTPEDSMEYVQSHCLSLFYYAVILCLVWFGLSVP